MSYGAQMLSAFLGALMLAWLGFLTREVVRVARAHRPPAEPVPTILERLMRDRLVVTLKSAETFSGVLWECDEKLLVLRSCWVVTPEGASDIMIDGDIVLLLADIAYTQKP